MEIEVIVTHSHHRHRHYYYDYHHHYHHLNYHQHYHNHITQCINNTTTIIIIIISTEQEGAFEPQQEVRFPSGAQRWPWGEQVSVRADHTRASGDAGSEQGYRSLG